MGVQIIEQFICSKYPDQKKCEDGLFISNDFIAVIDGVTSKGELTWPDGSEGGSEDDFARHDPGRACILPLLRRQFLLANQDRPYGYDVLDGFAIHSHHVSVYPVPPQTQVVLASDGYPVLKDTLAESEKSLDELLQKDPQCLRENRGTKGLVKGNQSFDDRTYVRFAVF